MKTEILKLLRESKDYVSGQELCERLGVSRTAIWKVINQLKEEGYEIEAVRNRGYCLKGAADVISEAELSSQIRGQWAGKNLVCYEETDSTNDRAKRLAEEGCPHGTLVVADCQKAGKGRRGRSWESPRGTSVYMSLVLRPAILPSAASMVTLVAAMAVAEGIQKAAGLRAAIKWPNDVVVNGRKICGILTEMSAEMDCIHYVVESFEKYYSLYEKAGDLSLIMDEYNSILANNGKEVRVLAPSGDYTGMSLGIEKDGELLVRTEDGEVKKVLSGEVSVRGIYGYV